MSNELTPWAVLRVAAVCTLSLALAAWIVTARGYAAGAVPFALSICALVGALAGGQRPYATAIGASVLFSASFVLGFAVVHPQEAARSTGLPTDLAVWSGVGIAFGIAAATVVQLLRWIVRKVKP